MDRRPLSVSGQLWDSLLVPVLRPVPRFVPMSGVVREDPRGSWYPVPTDL